MDPGWIGAVASVAAAVLAGLGLAVQLRARRPNIHFLFGGVGTDSSSVAITVAAQNLGDAAIRDLWFSPLLDGSPTGPGVGPFGVPPGQTVNGALRLQRPAQADIDANGTPTFHGRSFSARVQIGRRRRRDFPYHGHPG